VRPASANDRFRYAAGGVAKPPGGTGCGCSATGARNQRCATSPVGPFRYVPVVLVLLGYARVSTAEQNADLQTSFSEWATISVASRSTTDDLTAAGVDGGVRRMPAGQRPRRCQALRPSARDRGQRPIRIGGQSAISRNSVGLEATRPNTPGVSRNNATSARQSPPRISITARLQTIFCRVVDRQRLAPWRQCAAHRPVQSAGADRFQQHHRTCRRHGVPRRRVDLGTRIERATFTHQKGAPASARFGPPISRIVVWSGAPFQLINTLSGHTGAKGPGSPASLRTAQTSGSCFGATR